MAVIKQTIDIAASAEQLWDRLADVGHWPEWTPSVRRIDLLTGPLKMGARVRIDQPRLKPAVWTVELWQPHRQFTWATRSPGLSIVADHQIRRQQGYCAVEFSLAFGGLFGPIAQFFFGKLTRQYLAMEAAGLKKLCEQGSNPSQA